MPAPGKTSRTAVARMCAAEWRSTSSASGSRSVRMASRVSPSSGRSRSHTVPSTFAASAARASPGPIASATARGVVPDATSRTLPSGRVTLIVVAQGASWAAGGATAGVRAAYPK